MTGAEHYREGQRDIERADRADLSNGEAAYLLARAQVHATLAVSAAIADGLLGKLELNELGEWAKAVSS